MQPNDLDSVVIKQLFDLTKTQTVIDSRESFINRKELPTNYWLKKAIVAMVANKKPGDHMTYASLEHLMYYYGVGVAASLCIPAPSKAEIVASIGQLIQSGELASDMELYVPNKKG